MVSQTQRLEIVRNLVILDLGYSALCLDQIKALHMVRRLPHCHHVFHTTCCDEWVGKDLQRHIIGTTTYGTGSIGSNSAILRLAHLRCPMCRRELSPELTEERPNLDPAHDHDTLLIV